MNSANSNSANRASSRVPNGGRPVRVLLLLENGGYPEDVRLRCVAPSLRDAGYEVTVICPTEHSHRHFEVIDGIHVYRYPQPKNRKGFLGYMWEYVYSLAATFLLSLWVALRHGFDVVHVRTPPDMYVFIGAFYKLFGKYYVVDLNDLPAELYQCQRNGQGNRLVLKALLWFEWLDCKIADCLLASNESQRRVHIERGHARPELCHVVRNGPEPRYLEPVEPLSSLRPPGKLVIGYMGMIGVQDRVDMFVWALDSLQREFGRDDFSALVVGTGPALEDVQRLADELQMNDRVRFTGFIVGEELLRHIASFDICVTPDPINEYNHTCTMLKLMEYMAMGKPVVQFDLAENRLSAGDTALYARGEDARSLAEQIARLMEDAPLRERLGQAGRARVINRLQWKHQEPLLLAAYEEMLNPQKAASRVQPEPGILEVGSPAFSRAMAADIKVSKPRPRRVSARR